MKSGKPKKCNFWINWVNMRVNFRNWTKGRMWHVSIVWLTSLVSDRIHMCHLLQSTLAGWLIRCCFFFLWVPYATGQAIIFLPCGFFFVLLLSFFAHLFSAVPDWMSTILPHIIWPYCEFRIQVWNVQHAARWNTGRKKIAKKSLSVHHRTILSACIFAIKTCIDNRKKTC